MRPVTKIAWPIENGAPRNYNPASTAKKDLEFNLGEYCSYCEVYSSDLEVEHVISRQQDITLAANWDNFLLSCGRCNGRDNKTNKPVDLSIIHFPHKNNTLMSFSYLEGGYVKVDSHLTGTSLARAEAMLRLVGLDKIPGNPAYEPHKPNDTRWRHRRTAWEWAKKHLADFEAGSKTANDIVDFALQRGFFSVWFTVFKHHQAVRQLLVTRFLGTAGDCFDAEYLPVSRNPANPMDQV